MPKSGVISVSPFVCLNGCFYGTKLSHIKMKRSNNKDFNGELYCRNTGNERVCVWEKLWSSPCNQQNVLSDDDGVINPIPGKDGRQPFEMDICGS